MQLVVNNANPPLIVLDTSVWINLLATEEMNSIVRAIGHLCLVPDAVKNEVKRDPITNLVFTEPNHPLRNSRVIRRVELLEDEIDTFLGLVGVGGPRQLGDGEAAAIAVAVHRAAILAIDERKARRILQCEFTQVRLVRSIDVLRHDRVRRALGDQRVEECVAKARQFGRMHEPRD